MILSNLLEELEGAPFLRVDGLQELFQAFDVVARLRRLRRSVGIAKDSLSRSYVEMSPVRLFLLDLPMDLRPLSEAIRHAAEKALAEEFMGLFAQYGYQVSLDASGGITAERIEGPPDVVRLHLNMVDWQALLANTASVQSKSAEVACPSYVESREREELEDALGSLGESLADEGLSHS